MKIPRKIGSRFPKTDGAAPPPKSSSKGNVSPRTERSRPASPPPLVRGDGFETQAPRTRPRRPSNAEVNQVRGPDAGGAKTPRTNQEIRQWYLDKVGTIPELDKKWAAEGVPLEERARRAVAIRHDARIEARRMMSNPMEVAMLRARDFVKYGRVDGPNFEQLVKNARAKGLQGDDIYRELIGSSNRTNDTVNQHLLGKTRSKL